MSLRTVHIVFIVFATVLSFLLGLWALRRGIAECQRYYGRHRVDRIDFGSYPCIVRSDFLAKNQGLSMRRGIIIIASLVIVTPVLACEYCLGTGGANEQTIRALVYLHGVAPFSDRVCGYWCWHVLLQDSSPRECIKVSQDIWQCKS